MEKQDKTVAERLAEELGEGAEEIMAAPKIKPKKAGKAAGVVELDWDMDPTERLKAEMGELQENDHMRLVAEMLIGEFAKFPNLAAAYRDRKVTLKAVIDYIMSEAQKTAVNNRAMIEDKTVYGWAIHFVQDGKVKDAGKKPSVKILPKKTEEEIAEQAKKDFYEAEMKRLAEEKAKAEEAAKKEAEKAKAKAERQAKRDEERAAKKKAAEEAKKREKGYEQVSLFSFFEDTEGGKA